MVLAKIEVTTIINQWEPPFEKSKKIIEYIGDKNEEFDDEIGETAFRIIDIQDNYLILQYDYRFTLKKDQYKLYEDMKIGDELIKIPKDMEVEFSYMWGNKGITKKLKYVGTVEE